MYKLFDCERCRSHNNCENELRIDELLNEMSSTEQTLDLPGQLSFTMHCVNYYLATKKERVKNEKSGEA